MITQVQVGQRRQARHAQSEERQPRRGQRGAGGELTQQRGPAAVGQGHQEVAAAATPLALADLAAQQPARPGRELLAARPPVAVAEL